MNDCISREEVLEHYRVPDPAGTFAYCNSILDFVSSLPAADVKPVVRGKWIYDCERVAADGWTYRQHHCSVCGRKTIEADNYCPSCGAEMRGE